MKEVLVGLVLTLREGAEFGYCQKLGHKFLVRGWSLLTLWPQQKFHLGYFMLDM